MIDYFPFYDKFRAVSSIQIILEFCIPLVAVYALQQFFSNRIEKQRKLKTLYTLTLVICSFIFILYFFGNILFDFKSNFEIFSQYPDILNLLIEYRKLLLKSNFD